MMPARRIVYITASRADVYWWHDSRLQGPQSFAFDEAGLAAFDRYFYESRESLTSIIVDLVEEEFRAANIPHLSGKDRKAVVERRLQQFFRGTPYRGSHVIGREKTGGEDSLRYDDIVVFAALTNPDMLSAWTDRLSRHKVPLAGIYSPSFISEALVDNLGLKHENLLLISHQQHSGVRQTFFKNGQIKLSRLVSAAETDNGQYIDSLLTEVDNARRYMARMRLLSFTEMLDVCLVTDEDTAAIFRQQQMNTDLLRWHVYTVGEVMSGLGMSNDAARYSDHVFMRQLIRKTPAVDYSIAENRKYGFLRRLRLGMYAAAASVIMLSVIFSSMNLIEGGLLHQYNHEANESANQFEQKYKQAMTLFPQTPVRPEGLRESVAVARYIDSSKGDPAPVLAMIGNGLGKDDGLHIESVKWRMPDNTGSEPRQHVLIKGRVPSFNGDYRQAFERINAFSQALNNHDAVAAVEQVRMPLDVRSSASLRGQTGAKTGPDQSVFELRVLLGESAQ